MYKPFFLFLSLSLLFSGCYKVNKEEVKKPANLIPKEKMANLITDMEIIEGAAVYNKTHFPGYQEMKKEYYRSLFDRYHVTRKQVKASLDYYNSRGAEMAAIYDKALKLLIQKQDELNREQQKAEEEKFPYQKIDQSFPFLFKEDALSRSCINPLPE